MFFYFRGPRYSCTNSGRVSCNMNNTKVHVFIDFIDYLPVGNFGYSRFFKSLINSRQLDADSLSPPCSPDTSLQPVSVTPIATSTGTVSMLPSIRMWKQTPSKNKYLMDSSDKSRLLHFSTASINSLLTLLISAGDILRPISLVEIIERVRVLILVKNIKHKSWRISSSYRLLLGITWVLKSPLRSLGTLRSTSPIPFNVKLRL